MAEPTSDPGSATGPEPAELVERIAAWFAVGGAPFVRDLGFALTHAEPGRVVFTMPVTPPVTHGGGVLCGQAIMAGMDTGMVFVMMSLNGAADARFTTVQLQTAFERAVPADAGSVTFEAYATKPGRTLVFGQVDLLLPSGERAASATTTYLWL